MSLMTEDWHVFIICKSNSGFRESLLIISPVTRRAATWPLVLELIFFLSNNVRMSKPKPIIYYKIKATEMFLRDYNSNNCTQRQRLLLYAHGK